jgi:hypothetical protein
MPLTFPRSTTLWSGSIWADSNWAARRIAVGLSAAWLSLAAGACGARSALDVPPPLPPQPECELDEDCPGFDDLCAPTICIDPSLYSDVLPDLPAGTALPPLACAVIEPVECDDNDPCTEDTCHGDTGLCGYGPSTFDLDGDGHLAPLVGTEPGSEGSCGDDCNDASALAYPGNEEVCDGVDNDCNGVVDDNSSYSPLDNVPFQISSSALAPAGPGGLAFNGETYMSIYTSNTDFEMYQTRIEPDGTLVAPIEEKFTFQNADSGGGPLIWIGDRYGVAWQDRRDGNYEAYFTILKPDGGKAYPDTRLSFAPNFSVNVDLTWNGSEFIVSWQDRRNGLFEVMAQRVSIESVPVGDNVTLSNPGGFDDEAPSLASGESTLGLAFVNGNAGQQVIRFRTVEQSTLEPRSDIVNLSDNSSQTVFPQVVWNEDRYLISWYDRSGPVKAIFAATVSEEGEIITPATALTSPGVNRSRHPSLLPLGDRFLVVYADDRDQNNGYELYSRMLSTDLQPLSPEQRLTNAPFDSHSPVATFGPDGNVGILFEDERDNGADHVWFTRLGCVTAP